MPYTWFVRTHSQFAYHAFSCVLLPDILGPSEVMAMKYSSRVLILTAGSSSSERALIIPFGFGCNSEKSKMSPSAELSFGNAVVVWFTGVIAAMSFQLSALVTPGLVIGPNYVANMLVLQLPAPNVSILFLQPSISAVLSLLSLCSFRSCDFPCTTSLLAAICEWTYPVAWRPSPLSSLDFCSLTFHFKHHLRVVECGVFTFPIFQLRPHVRRCILKNSRIYGRRKCSTLFIIFWIMQYAAVVGTGMGYKAIFRVRRLRWLHLGKLQSEKYYRFSFAEGAPLPLGENTKG